MFPVSLIVGTAALGTSWYLFSSQRMLIDGSYVALTAFSLLVASLIITIGWRRVEP